MQIWKNIKEEFIEKPIQTGSLILGGIATLIATLVGFVFWCNAQFFDRLDASGVYMNVQMPDELRYLSYDIPESSRISTTTQSYFGYTKSFWSLNIKNNYKNILKGVYVKTPFEGLYSVNDAKTVLPFKAEIALGDLKPDDQIQVLVYAGEGGYSFTEDELKVGYDGGGVSKIEFPTQVYGFWKLVVSVRYFLLPFVFYAIVIFGALKLDQYQKKKKEDPSR